MNKEMRLVLVVLALVLSLLMGCTKDKDKTAPIISLIGSSPMNHPLGQAFTDPGATATDDVDGDISAQIEISGSVNTQVEGDYYLYYNVEDKAGNKAVEVQRKVKVLIF